eukprot:Polyplicarium_translucidae@DN3568_c0_g1_i1.p1
MLKIPIRNGQDSSGPTQSANTKFAGTRFGGVGSWIPPSGPTVKVEVSRACQAVTSPRAVVPLRGPSPVPPLRATATRDRAASPRFADSRAFQALTSPRFNPVLHDERWAHRMPPWMRSRPLPTPTRRAPPA